MLELELEFLYELCIINYVFYLQKFPIIRYFDLTWIITYLCGYFNAKTFRNGNDLHFIVEKGNRVIFGTGSSTFSYSEWYDRQIGNFETFPVHRLGEFYIHQGYYNYVDDLLKGTFVQEIKKIAKNPDKEIILTGHSRGGAISSVLAIRLLKDFNLNTTVFTFGEPQTMYTTGGLPAVKKYRVMDYSDSVPMFGTLTTRFQHWGDLVLLVNKSVLEVKEGILVNGLTNDLFIHHALSNYINRIQLIRNKNVFIGLTSPLFYFEHFKYKIFSFLERSILVFTM